MFEACKIPHGAVPEMCAIPSPTLRAPSCGTGNWYFDEAIVVARDDEMIQIIIQQSGFNVRTPRRYRVDTWGMLAYMKRTTVKIPDALDARLRHEARRRNLTISEVSREALEAYLGVPGGRRRLNAAAVGRSGRSDVSERIEEILAAEVGR